MANLTLDDDLKLSISNHATAYLGGDIPGVLDGEYTSDDDTTFKLTIEQGEFLNTKGKLEVFIVKDAKSAILCIKPTIEAKTFAEYFPQMLPQNPWLIERKAKLAFPNLADRKVPDIKWWYACVVAAEGETDVSQALWNSFYKAIDKDKEFVEQLKSIGRDDDFSDKKTGWQGGLFYFGTLPKLPFEGMIPKDLNTAWSAVVDNVKLQGCVYHQSLVPYLKFQIPIINKTDPFDDKVVKKIEFATTFSSPLEALEQTEREDEDEKVKLKQDREASLAGYIDFGSQNISLKGVWPFDNDVFRIEASSTLKDLKEYLDDSSVFKDIIPDNIAIDIAFGISKSEKRLETINFNIAAGDWTIVKNILTIKQAQFNFNVTHPGIVNIVTAKFSAAAQIGTNDKLVLLCTGAYPDGEIRLYLDPEKKVFLADILGVFTSKEVGFGNKIAVTALGGSYDLGNKYFAFEMVVQNTDWKAGDLGFTLDNLRVGIYGRDSFTFKLDAAFKYTCKNKTELKFTGSAEYNDSWRFSGSYSGSISLMEIAQEFNSGSYPSQLSNFTFTSMAFAFDTGEDCLKYFGGACKISLLGEEVLLALKIQKTNTVTYFSGGFDVAENKFQVDFTRQDTGSYTLALQILFKIAGAQIYLNALSEGGEGKIAEKTFSGGTTGLSLNLTDVLKEIVGTATNYNDLPLDFLPDIKLNDVFVNYNGKTKQTSLIAYAQISSVKQIRLFIQHQPAAGETKAVYAFGIDTEVPGLDQLPLVGGEMKNVKLEGVGFIYTSEAGSYTLPKLSATRTIEFAPKTEYAKGVTMVGNINLPGQDEPIDLALPLSAQSAMLMHLGDDGVYVLNADDTSSLKPAIKWINIDKRVGPVAVNKIGFKYANGQLSLLISGALMLADLALSVEGLGLSFSPTELIKGNNIKAEFKLEGLGIAFDRAPIEISGMLLRNDPAANESISFYGAALIAASGFSISGIGAYSKLKEGNKDSLFIFGVYNGPIGGPAIFFVTGIAAGFGYNRTIKIPTLDKVKDFPLVEMVLSSKPKTRQELLKDLIENDWIPASSGDYWMAVGIKFTSFKIIESFILLIVKFGTKVEFAIIGLALLKWPNKGNPIVYIELALLAKFGPDSDVIAINGMLTSNSYIFDKNCKITGGFAFYTWISGKHEGDFVITLGGYSPTYKIPEHYPVVDRLALNWKLSDALSVRGEMYYALTPREIMAGGRWEIAYNLSFLSARVSIWADMYISWAPFSYDLSAGIIVRIEANIKVLFVHVNFKLQMGCAVHIWGPPFAGEIYVDWTIFSFTIPFGSGEKPSKKALQWEENKLLTAGDSSSNGNSFKDSFIPLDDNKNPRVLDVRIVSGVVTETENKKEDKNALYKNDTADAESVPINAYDLVIAVDSFFPVKDLYTGNAKKTVGLSATNEPPTKKAHDSSLMQVAGTDIPKTIGEREKSFGIRPMDIPELQTQLHVWLEDERGKPVEENITIIGGAKGVNSALWGPHGLPKEGKNLRSNGAEPDAVIKNVLSGIQLHATEKSDDDIEKMALSKLYMPLTNTAEVPPLPVIDAETHKKEEIKKIITGALEKNQATTTYEQLKALGFTELIADKKPLLFNDILNSTPVYVAGIGQLLPTESVA
jgi:hypothetical protein